MKVVKFAFLIFVFVFGATMSVKAQCCCSNIRFSLVDKKGKELDLSKVKAANISTDPSIRREHQIGVASNSDKELNLGVGCAFGEDFVSVIYKGAEMKINFKYFGDFGMVRGKITFQKGNFIAEPEKIRGAMGAEGIKIRKPTEEESKTFPYNFLNQ